MSVDQFLCDLMGGHDWKYHEDKKGPYRLCVWCGRIERY